ncbi:MAG: HigA family addiction module antitoxin [Treponema sp.]|nr:HigA family addiction module antitoxin [Treponema sp.]
MPKTARPQTPGDVLQSFIEEYQINAFSLSKSLNVAYQSVTHIISGKARISVQMALRLAQYFGNSARYWIDIQASSEIDELSADKKFIAVIKKIPKAQKPSGKTKKEPKSKAGKKPNALSEKRKKAAKVPGAKKARGRKAGSSMKK